jgi:hypothetical protein
MTDDHRVQCAKPKHPALIFLAGALLLVIELACKALWRPAGGKSRE